MKIIFFTLGLLFTFGLRAQNNNELWFTNDIEGTVGLVVPYFNLTPTAAVLFMLMILLRLTLAVHHKVYYARQMIGNCMVWHLEVKIVQV